MQLAITKVQKRNSPSERLQQQKNGYTQAKHQWKTYACSNKNVYYVRYKKQNFVIIL